MPFTPTTQQQQLQQQVKQDSSQHLTINFDILPNELLILIFSFLSSKDLAMLPIVCQRWNRILKDDDVWKLVIENQWGRLPFHLVKPGNWKNEFYSQTKQEEIWKYGGNESQIFSPKIGATVDFLHIEASPLKVVCGSTLTGNLSEFDPKSGTILSLISFQNNQIPQISWMKSYEGKIVLGYHDGRISIFSKSPFYKNQVSNRNWYQKNYNAKYIPLPNLYHVSNKIITMDERQSIRIYDPSNESHEIKLFNFASENSTITTLCCHPKDNLIFCGLDNGSIVGTDFKGNKLEQCCQLMPTPIQFLECKQSLLLVSQQNGSLMLLNPLTLSCIYELICDEGIVCYQWIEELNIIVGGSENGTLTLWNYPKSLSTSKIFPHWKSQAHNGRILKINVDSFKIISTGIDGHIRVWNTLSGALLRTLDRRTRSQKNNYRPREELTSLNAYGKFVFGASNGRVKFWNFDLNSKPKATQESPKKLKKPPHFYNMDIRNELREGQEEVEAEKIQRTKNRDTYGSLEGISEDELMQYVLMLSLGESDAPESFHQLIGNQIPEDVQLQWAMKQSLSDQ